VQIREFQQFIEDKFSKTDRARGAAATFVWFIEEVGELASAIAGTDQKNKEEEFADVFGWLCSLANIQGVDMQQAVRDKFIDRDPGPPK
jgi:NTP pyrophosphatase (non-canonical NTP hydrolase)